MEEHNDPIKHYLRNSTFKEIVAKAPNSPKSIILFGRKPFGTMQRYYIKGLVLNCWPQCIV